MKHGIFLTVIALLMVGCTSSAQTKEPWNDNQLMDPATLAGKISNRQTNGTLILCVGPDAPIKGSVDMGAAHESGNIGKLKDYLKKVKKDTEIVIYCGCCPIQKCPNVRPAFTALNEMGFKNARLLNLPKNIKVDWLDHNYLTSE
ncbi:MAG: rhodanese-like domain-containing protein [Chitinophagaceae bacterium]|jgi:hypothetical protein|nr:rhodanese-like domain-containing protein [Chitinophagaceae bacterium]